MSKAIQRRRGTTAEHAGFTGLVGELTIDTTKKTAVVHDGVTAGGHPLAKENHNHDTTYATKAHENSTSAHPEMVASDAEVDAGTGSKWVKVSQLIRATVKTITDILPVTLGGTGASTAAGARTNLGLGSVAVENTVPVAKGGTGAATAAAARTNLGLGEAATRAVATTPVGAADSGKLPALDATGKLPADFVPLPDLSYVPEAGHAVTADHATTAGSTTSATTAQTADQAANADKTDGYHASKSPNPGTIPVADAAGKLDAGWLPPIEAATVGGFAPSQTPGASKVPVADAAGKLASGWFPDLNISGVPTGGIVYIAGNTVPTGFVKANGGELSRTTYAALFAVIGTTYGAGNGSTTFNVPDLRGQFIRSWDNGRGVDTGRAIGSAQADANKSHSHTGTAASAGGHTHTTSIPIDSSDGGSAVTVNGSRKSSGARSYSSSSAGAHTHSLSIAANGGDESRPKNIAMLAIIKY